MNASAQAPSPSARARPNERSALAGEPFVPERELRIALVMYGGVSLAIYMNGVAQELIRLVQATAPSPNDPTRLRHMPTRDGSEDTRDVYREIAHRLGARFVIDVLAGSSAGGINAVFMAKALACGADIEALERVWIDEADVHQLLFDRRSLKNTKQLTLPASRPSLFNGDRMFQKLLDALGAIGSTAAPTPYVDDIDLYITATDLEGVITPISLSDKMVDERRHRQVFHLKTHHFAKSYDPFLAFAARCTSSFPVAFEPPALSDLRRICPSPTAGELEKQIGAWKDFFPSYRDDRETPYQDRVFADGGYLDNKPFESVLDCIEARDGKLPADRVLLYVEPEPEDFDAAARLGTAARPHAFENALSAFTLARKETIRGEVARANFRKRHLERMTRILADVHKDAANLTPELVLDGRWGDRKVADLIVERGAAYGGYHRGKVGAVADELAEHATRILGFPRDDSDRTYVLWLLIRAWRKHHYYCYSDDGNEVRSSETEFLVSFDNGYRLRRLYFVLRVLDDLLEGSRPRAAKSAAGKSWISALQTGQIEVPTAGLPAGAVRAVRGLLQRVLNDHRRLLREALEGLRVKYADLARCDFATLLERLSSSGHGNAEDAVYQQLEPAMREDVSRMMNDLKQVLKDRLIDLATHVRAGLTPVASDGIEHTWAKRAAEFFYDRYENYDAVIFPLLQGTGALRPGSLEIYRISPDDSTLRRGSSKLGGASFGAFGAFLNEDWRRADLTWGRLDAAERIISILLPSDELQQERERFIRRARESICRDAGEAARERSEPGGWGVAAAPVDPNRFLEELKRSSPTPLRSPGRLYEAGARASVVLSKLLDTVSHGSGPGAVVTNVIARVAQLMLALVQVSNPRGFLIHPFRGALALLTLAGVLIMVAGPIVHTELFRLGVWLLLATLGVYLLHAATTALLAGVRLRKLVAVGVLGLVGFAGYGVHHTTTEAIAWFKATRLKSPPASDVQTAVAADRTQ